MSYPYVQPKNLMNRPQIEVVCLLLDATATISTNLILPRIYVHFLNVFSLMNRVCSSTPLSLSRLSIDSHAVEYFCCVRPAWQNLIVSAFPSKTPFLARQTDIVECIVSENS